MRRPYVVLLTLAALSPATVVAQAANDTLPERVVARAYEAFNRHDAAAYFDAYGPPIPPAR